MPGATSGAAAAAAAAAATTQQTQERALKAPDTYYNIQNAASHMMICADF